MKWSNFSRNSMKSEMIDFHQFCLLAICSIFDLNFMFINLPEHLTNHTKSHQCGGRLFRILEFLWQLAELEVIRYKIVDGKRTTMISTRVSAENYVCQSTYDEDDEFACSLACLSFFTSQRHRRSLLSTLRCCHSVNCVVAVRGRNVTLFFSSSISLLGESIKTKKNSLSGRPVRSTTHSNLSKNFPFS